MVAVDSPLVGSPMPARSAGNKLAPHDHIDEIIRQVEYYFGDDNLPHDAHLLGLLEEGQGSVSLNEICGFRRMKQYRPKGDVREVLRRYSTTVVVSDCGKRLQRRYPLNRDKITKMPRLNRPKQLGPQVDPNKPWLTKGMLKPTGFEEYATDGPITPEQAVQDAADYDPEMYSFVSRIEKAVGRFNAGHTMHQNKRAIFDKFMIYGGMSVGQREFIGGLEEREMEDLTKKEIKDMTSNYGVSELVLDGLYDDSANGGELWHVDFEATAKGFLSSEVFKSYKVGEVINVIDKFCRFLLQRNVCNEFKDQLMAALKVYTQAKAELPRLDYIAERMPGGFNMACSTLFKGEFTDKHASNGDWVLAGDNFGWSQKDAEQVFSAGIFAHGNEEQMRQLEEAGKSSEKFHIVSTLEHLGLEITGIELAHGEAMSVYASSEFSNTLVKPMGKLFCKLWEIPNAAPMDLPASEWKRRRSVHNYEFLIEDEMLKCFVPGMKLECCVKEIDLGVKWIDYAEVYPSFFTYLPNLDIRRWKEPGPMEAWRLRSMGREVDQGNEEEDLVV